MGLILVNNVTTSQQLAQNLLPAFAQAGRSALDQFIGFGFIVYERQDSLEVAREIARFVLALVSFNIDRFLIHNPRKFCFYRSLIFEMRDLR